MKLNKKAMDFGILLFVIVLVSLSALSLTMLMKRASFDKNIGETQIGLLNIYQKSEKALFYIDQAAKYSAQQALSDLDLTVEDLKDESPKKVFEFTFKQYLDQYIKAYSEIGIPTDNYNILIKDNKIIGIATKNIIIKKDTITYSIKPSFTISIE